MSFTQNSLPLWLDHLSFNVLKRSLVLALIIGSLLTLINQFSAVFGEESFKILPLVQVLLTPFGVITFSQMGATQQAMLNGQETSRSDRLNILNTVFAHGIPRRALLIAMAALSVNVLLTILLMPQSPVAVVQSSWPLLVQSFFVPLMFGAFSQAVTYRRHVAV